jgi:hypothetical protein
MELASSSDASLLEENLLARTGIVHRSDFVLFCENVSSPNTGEGNYD